MAVHRLAALPVAALTLLALSGCVGVTTTKLSDVSAEQGDAGPHVVTIDGAGTATIAVDEDGAGSQQTGVALPHHITLDASVRTVSVVAQLENEDAGSGISCAVTDLDNTVLKEAQSSGDYAVASCAVALQ